MKHSKSETPDISPSCGGSLEEGETTFTAGFGSGVVVIRNVPATICTQCGMEWLDDAITDKIETIVKQAKEKHSIVEVMSLSA
ncbi:type II toxin-antitoxin system MqsA family antitoxin [Gracilimonas tropica]|uniref:type II toxin-antitoxin system MqsA family antitoxin n=1 Tax=Gracilimonas tropica TaxID=454600 RepID=UPI00036687DB|nr:type II toxin-antitoxin system MqsA family antitoxin [Gracilimonas tropica]